MAFPGAQPYPLEDSFTEISDAQGRLIDFS